MAENWTGYQPHTITPPLSSSTVLKPVTSLLFPLKSVSPSGGTTSTRKTLKRKFSYDVFGSNFLDTSIPYKAVYFITVPANVEWRLRSLWIQIDNGGPNPDNIWLQIVLPDIYVPLLGLYNLQTPATPSIPINAVSTIQFQAGYPLLETGFDFQQAWHGYLPDESYPAGTKILINVTANQPGDIMKGTATIEEWA
jgi:hypothetical protein